MKRLNTTLIAVIAVLIIACNPETVDYTIVTGNIVNYSTDEVKVVSDNRSEVILKTDSLGNISDTLRLDEGIYYIGLGKSYTSIYVFHGGKLQLSADANDFMNTLSFSGEMSGMSNYLLTKTKLNNAERKKFKKLFTLDEATFMEKVTSKMDTLKAELEKVIDIPDSLRFLESKAIKIGYIYMLNNYQSYYPYLSKKEDYTPSEELKSEISDFDNNDEALFQYSSDYKGLLNSDLRAKSQELVEAGETSSNLIATLMVGKNIESEVIREELLFNSIKRGLARSEDKKEVYNTYMEIAKDEEHRKEMTEKYNKINMLDKGKPSPKFVGYENYSEGTSSLDDFKGKYVYIDVWATWCGPCKAEIPHLKKVEEKYHNKNIVFVSISVDNEKDKENWKKMIAEKEMGGVQLFATDKKFMDDYVISGIPRFILLDPEGKIVEKNAPRPSDEKLIELFDELGI